MDRQKVRHSSRYWVFVVIFLSIAHGGFATLANAQGWNLSDLDQAYGVGVQRSYGSTRVKKTDRMRCKSCEQKEAEAISEYLDRTLKEKGSASYKREIESIIFADSKFVNGCWKKANKKRLEVFFTIDESGLASDFAWFPKHKVGKCIERHISKIEFPNLNKPHHAWLVASGNTR